VAYDKVLKFLVQQQMQQQQEQQQDFNMNTLTLTASSDRHLQHEMENASRGNDEVGGDEEDSVVLENDDDDGAPPPKKRRREDETLPPFTQLLRDAYGFDPDNMTADDYEPPKEISFALINNLYNAKDVTNLLDLAPAAMSFSKYTHRIDLLNSYQLGVFYQRIQLLWKRRDKTIFKHAAYSSFILANRGKFCPQSEYRDDILRRQHWAETVENGRFYPLKIDCPWSYVRKYFVGKDEIGKLKADACLFYHEMFIAKTKDYKSKGMREPVFRKIIHAVPAKAKPKSGRK